MPPLKDWFTLASVAEQKELALLCNSSTGFLRQIAEGRRRPSAAFAIHLEAATRVMHKQSNLRLPIIYQGASCAACAECPYYNKKR